MSGFRREWPVLAGIFLAVFTGGCGSPESQPPDSPTPLVLDEWEAVDWGGSGRVAWDPAEGILSLGTGQPVTMAKWTGNPELLPGDSFEIRWEARRTEGEDFFCGLVFPVGDVHISFIAGGWRGQVTGFSNVNGYDASENQTRVWVPLANDLWHRFRIEVSAEWIRAEINGKQVVGLHRPGKILAMRSGELEALVPLGFATWRSSGEIRNAMIQKLSPARE